MIEPTLVMVVCNEAHRLEALLQHVRPHFNHIAIGVQESSDGTREIVERYANEIVDDKRHGFGDASFPLVQRKVTTTWAFRVDADEWPTLPLLENLPTMIEAAEAGHYDGVWIPFRSWIEGVEWEVPHSHMRLWRNQRSWPPKLHSRPKTEREIFWPTGSGYIHHSKTLDEHVRGYLDYLAVSGDNQSWIRHNLVMIAAACRGSAEAKGWDFVMGHEWWPVVAERVFHGEDPTIPAEVSPEP